MFLVRHPSVKLEIYFKRLHKKKKKMTHSKTWFTAYKILVFPLRCTKEKLIIITQTPGGVDDTLLFLTR